MSEAEDVNTAVATIRMEQWCPTSSNVASIASHSRSQAANEAKVMHADYMTSNPTIFAEILPHNGYQFSGRSPGTAKDYHEAI